MTRISWQCIFGEAVVENRESFLLTKGGLPVSIFFFGIAKLNYNKNEVMGMAKKKPLAITYLFHSGFLVETEECLLVFDYYRDAAASKPPTFTGFPAPPAFLQTEKAVFVMVSHHHADHYNPVILEWEKGKPDLTYVLSSEIKPKRQVGRIFLVSPGDVRAIDPLFLKVFGSTDQGVSFLVEVEGWRLFHAGDLNWWYWWDDPEDQRVAAGEAFKAEIDRLRGEWLDVAFFPVDPRLGAYSHLGGAYFIQQLKPAFFIPMHFGADYQVTARFAEQVRTATTKVVPLSQSPQKILLACP
ncbi:MAG TPA: MBL fold metallo-hydrolase [Capillibacterium sp.]